MTGYWVSIVAEDWRWRMFPNKGDYGGVPLNAEARKIADAWDPAKDEAAGEQCKAYGAPNIMRIPGRLHITWQDDQTLRSIAMPENKRDFFISPPRRLQARTCKVSRERNGSWHDLGSDLRLPVTAEDHREVRSKY